MAPRIGWRAAVAVAALAPAVAACQPNTVSVSYRPEAGARYRYEVTVDSDAVTRLAGHDAERSTRTTDLHVRHRVLDTARSSAEVEVQLDPSTGPTRTFVVRFDRAAQVTEVERVEGLPAEVLGDLGLSELFPAAAGAPPDRPLAPGDRWTIDEPLRLSGLRSTRLRGQGRVVALGVIDGRKVATLATTYRLPVRRTVDDPQGQLILDGEQETTSRATRDLQDGSVEEATARTVGRFRVTVLPPPGTAGTPVEGTLTVTVTSRTRRTG